MKQEKVKKIAVLGCGWLGLPLAKKLLSQGYLVKGSTTHKEKISALEAVGISAYLLHCNEDNCEGIEQFLKDVDVLILTLPPGLRQNPNRRFDKVIASIKAYLELTTVQKVIFISSTSVYGNASGDVTEETPTHPITESGKQLLRCEEMLLSASAFKTTILRFGGLIGPQRHPIHTLAKRSFIDNPNNFINFIHLEDCLQCLLAILENQHERVVYNAVGPYYLTREKYYKTLAKKANIQLPPFTEKTTNKRRIISTKIQNALNVKFNVENLLTLN